MQPLGKKVWALAEGYIPGWSCGPEPLASHETACILNTGDEDANVEIRVFFRDREPIGPFPLTVGARRTLLVRFNDLRVPARIHARIPEDTPFASVIVSDVPVVVHHTRLDSRHAENALMSTMAYPADD